MANVYRSLAVGVCLLTSEVSSADAADHVIAGKKLVLTATKLVILSNDAGVSLDGSDPVGGAESSITFEAENGPITYPLPKTLWRAKSAGNIFLYRNKAAAPGSPAVVKLVKVKPGMLKVVSKGYFPFAVPNGNLTMFVVLRLDNGRNTYCLSFDGEGDGIRFVAKDSAPSASCPLYAAACGNDFRQGGEDCDGPDDSACPGVCQENCTCRPCGNNMRQDPDEHCDGTDALACPGECREDCTCPFVTCTSNSDCPPGEVCSFSTLAGGSVCVVGTVACDSNGFPTCGGACPGGEECGAITIGSIIPEFDTNECRCLLDGSPCEAEGGFYCSDSCHFRFGKCQPGRKCSARFVCSEPPIATCSAGCVPL